MTKSSCSIVLVGIGGYGEIYLQAMWEEDRFSQLEGVVDIAAEEKPFYKRLKENNIPIYSSLTDFYQFHQADLAVIASPIQFHSPQVIQALENESNVLCEKPISGSFEEAEAMRKAKNKSGKFAAVGFNWSFTSSIQSLKRDILAGRLGKPLKAKSLVLWPRDEAYFTRASWAGKAWGVGDAPIFDSVANNATAHFLHNLYYILGREIHKSAKVEQLEFELYRANRIETFDTCALRAFTEDGVEINYYASHAVEEETSPIFSIQFEEAEVVYNTRSGLKVRWVNGEEKQYGNPEEEHMKKLDICIEAVVNQHQLICCGLEEAYSHLLSLQEMNNSLPKEEVQQEFMKRIEHKALVYIPELGSLFKKCYEKELFPRELGIEWTGVSRKTTIPSRFYPKV